MCPAIRPRRGADGAGPPEPARGGHRPLRVCLFGTYDQVAHPRIAILREALLAAGAEVIEAHVPGWRGGTREKLETAARPLRPATLASLARTWARLARRYRAAGAHD